MHSPHDPRSHLSRAPIAGLAVVFALLLTATTGVRAASVLDEWDTIKAPPAPQTKPVVLDPRTTAVLMLDFMKYNCGVRPRCMATLPAVARMLAQARAAGATVIYSLVPPRDVAETLPEVAPKGQEPLVSSGPDKFIGTNLEQLLKERGIQTVIAVGTAAHGAVIHTGSSAALRGFRVIVPVDGMSSESAYPEQYVAWHFANAPVASRNVTLTTLGQMSFAAK